MLNRPSKVLLTALATLQAHHFTEESRILKFISEVQAKMTPCIATNFTQPIKEDLLYETDYDHRASNIYIGCDRSKLKPRRPRDHKEPVFHYRLIVSTNQVVKDGRQRD